MDVFQKKPQNIAIHTSPSHDLRVADCEVPKLAADECLVHVRATGICGSDLHGYHACVTTHGLPRTAGHELAGKVVALGEAVTRHTVGDRVTVEPTVPCNDCPECYSGNYNLCSRLSHIGGPALGGGFAEYMVAPEDNVYALPPPFL